MCLYPKTDFPYLLYIQQTWPSAWAANSPGSGHSTCLKSGETVQLCLRPRLWRHKNHRRHTGSRRQRRSQDPHPWLQHPWLQTQHSRNYTATRKHGELERTSWENCPGKKWLPSGWEQRLFFDHEAWNERAYPSNQSSYLISHKSRDLADHVVPFKTRQLSWIGSQASRNLYHFHPT